MSNELYEKIYIKDLYTTESLHKINLVDCKKILKEMGLKPAGSSKKEVIERIVGYADGEVKNPEYEFTKLKNHLSEFSPEDLALRAEYFKTTDLEKFLTENIERAKQINSGKTPISSLRLWSGLIDCSDKKLLQKQALQNLLYPKKERSPEDLKLLLDFKKLSRDELRAACSDRKLLDTGTKEELKERLLKYLDITEEKTEFSFILRPEDKILVADVEVETEIYGFFFLEKSYLNKKGCYLVYKDIYPTGEIKYTILRQKIKSEAEFIKLYEDQFNLFIKIESEAVKSENSQPNVEDLTQKMKELTLTETIPKMEELPTEKLESVRTDFSNIDKPDSKISLSADTDKKHFVKLNNLIKEEPKPKIINTPTNTTTITTPTTTAV